MDFFSWEAPGAGWRGEPLVRHRTMQPLGGSSSESLFDVAIYVVPGAITQPRTPGFPRHLAIQPAAKGNSLQWESSLHFHPLSPMQQGNTQRNHRRCWCVAHKTGTWRVNPAEGWRAPFSANQRHISLGCVSKPHWFQLNFGLCWPMASSKGDICLQMTVAAGLPNRTKAGVLRKGRRRIPASQQTFQYRHKCTNISAFLSCPVQSHWLQSPAYFLILISWAKPLRKPEHPSHHRLCFAVWAWLPCSFAPFVNLLQILQF